MSQFYTKQKEENDKKIAGVRTPLNVKGSDMMGKPPTGNSSADLVEKDSLGTPLLTKDQPMPHGEFYELTNFYLEQNPELDKVFTQGAAEAAKIGTQVKNKEILPKFAERKMNQFLNNHVQIGDQSFKTNVIESQNAATAMNNAAADEKERLLRQEYAQKGISVTPNQLGAKPGTRFPDEALAARMTPEQLLREVRGIAAQESFDNRPRVDEFGNPIGVDEPGPDDSNMIGGGSESFPDPLSKSDLFDVDGNLVYKSGKGGGAWIIPPGGKAGKNPYDIDLYNSEGVWVHKTNKGSPVDTVPPAAANPPIVTTTPPATRDGPLTTGETLKGEETPEIITDPTKTRRESRTKKSDQGPSLFDDIYEKLTDFTGQEESKKDSTWTERALDGITNFSPYPDVSIFDIPVGDGKNLGDKAKEWAGPWMVDEKKKGKEGEVLVANPDGSVTTNTKDLSTDISDHVFQPDPNIRPKVKVDPKDKGVGNIAVDNYWNKKTSKWQTVEEAIAGSALNSKGQFATPLQSDDTAMSPEDILKQSSRSAVERQQGTPPSTPSAVAPFDLADPNADNGVDTVVKKDKAIDYLTNWTFGDFGIETENPTLDAVQESMSSVDKMMAEWNESQKVIKSETATGNKDLIKDKAKADWSQDMDFIKAIGYFMFGLAASGGNPFFAFMYANEGYRVDSARTSRRKMLPDLLEDYTLPSSMQYIQTGEADHLDLLSDLDKSKRTAEKDAVALEQAQSNLQDSREARAIKQAIPFSQRVRLARLETKQKIASAEQEIFKNKTKEEKYEMYVRDHNLSYAKNLAASKGSTTGKTHLEHYNDLMKAFGDGGTGRAAVYRGTMAMSSVMGAMADRSWVKHQGAFIRDPETQLNDWKRYGMTGVAGDSYAMTAADSWMRLLRDNIDAKWFSKDENLYSQGTIAAEMRQKIEGYDYPKEGGKTSARRALSEELAFIAAVTHNRNMTRSEWIETRNIHFPSTGDSHELISNQAIKRQATLMQHNLAAESQGYEQFDRESRKRIARFNSDVNVTDWKVKNGQSVYRIDQVTKDLLNYYKADAGLNEWVSYATLIELVTTGGRQEYFDSEDRKAKVLQQAKINMLKEAESWEQVKEEQDKLNNWGDVKSTPFISTIK